jgi:hypothetical protein
MDRPRWFARDAHERRAMQRWVIKQLDDADAAERRRLAGGDLDTPWTPPFPDPPPDLSAEQAAERAAAWDKWLRDGGIEREAAKHGVIGPARAKAPPLLADLVQLPPLKRGEKHLRLGGMSPDDKRRDAEGRSLAFLEAIHRGRVANAAADVERIRALWQAEYRQQNRPGSQISAVEIAAARHGVSAKEVVLHLKNFSRNKSPIS